MIAAAHDRFERGADGVLVAVDRRAVEVPVADRGGALDRLGDLASARRDRSRTCRAPRRHDGAGVQPLRDRRRVDRPPIPVLAAMGAS